MITAKKHGAPCIKGCGRYVISQVGSCRFCRTIKCGKCGEKLLQLYEGQKTHTFCKNRKAVA